MYTLFPSTLILHPCPSKPPQAFSPLKTKPPNSSFSSSCKLLNPQNPCPKPTQLPPLSSISASEQSLLLKDWPQLLQISIGYQDLMLGLALHGFLVKLGPQNDPFQGNNLVNMYTKFNRLDDAQRVFDKMLIRNTITWTSLINGYSQINDTESVFRIAHEMYRFGEEFNEHTCTVVLQACGLSKDQIRGEQIHSFAIKSGFEENIYVATSLVSMYSRSGYLDDAERVFKNLAEVDIRCLNSMILEYGKAGEGEKAIQAFCHLQASGLEPNDYTFTNVISSCNGDPGEGEGRQLHGLAVKYGFVDEISVGNAVITMYAKHGLLEEAERMLQKMGKKNLVSWTALLSGYVKNGYGEKTIGGFLEMLDLGIYFDSSCLTTVLDGCSECKNMDLGLQIHGFVMKLGYLSDVFVGTALVDAYVKCGNLRSARLVSKGLSHKNTASFNAILTGYMEKDGDTEEDVMVLFSQMRLAGMQPDSVTFAQLLSLSADQASIVKGKSLHAYTIKTGLEDDFSVGNAVITMYAKCGSIEHACRMFTGMVSHDSVSWNAMISGYALHGRGKEALLRFEEMRKEGFLPDKITMLAALQACSYSGLCEEGFRLFNDMEPRYGIKPVIEHHACMVDLLGRAGHSSDAVDFIKCSQFAASPLLWRTLVNICKLQGDMNFGILASKYLLNLAPDQASSYILVSNMYAGGGMLKAAAEVRTVMNDLKVSKEAGCSWIEIENQVHRFVASDRDHPAYTEIYAKIEELWAEMKGKCDSTIDPLIELQSRIETEVKYEL
ncbi:hypothetical protein HHK36_017309 [Tetracentron sinense]|uniref:Uncharacterized protein n=1 Tax=Tetracentron sinense TaxID=13715 RepID=A0A834Z288_TETSI|nr:hypothetical protein HHK36_017309 [Tetracentron sinense]